MSHLDSRSEDDMGRAAYEAYCQSVGGKSPITGDDLPEYKELPLPVRTGWIAAGRAVATAVRNERHG